MASRRIPGYPPNCVTLLVDQEDVGDERSAVETVLSAHQELGCLEEGDGGWSWSWWELVWKRWGL